MATGFLIVSVYNDNIAQPVENAVVEVVGLEKTMTNMYGKTNKIALYAPEKEYSMNEQKEVRPYSTYKIIVSKKGLVTKIIEGVEVLADEVSYQDVYTTTVSDSKDSDTITLPEHELWLHSAPKIVEDAFKLEPAIVKGVLVPEYIVVHNGIPSNTQATRYYVSFPDYLKNVASSEIYPTWPLETLKANIHAIASFTLNRIYTEWYLSKGYNFTITASPQYDQKYIPNRTIFESISKVVDQYFTTYIKLPDRSQPLFAQYNDGVVVNNTGWLSQWGSKTLGDQGYSALNILRRYYGNQVYLATAGQIEGLPTSFPGYNMKVGACGEEVKRLQNQLNTIRKNYPAIPQLVADGKFGENTKKAVEKFQEVFGLSKDGVVGFTTWYKINFIYVAVTKMAAGV